MMGSDGDESGASRLAWYLQMHDILGGDKQLVQELLHDMKREAASQRQAAAAPAANMSSTQAGD